ncbi:MAG: hypothetical protein HEP71_17880 [Roseivirga sp.]|nr:hypothetical protein [Roseivirga sp.]
MGLHKGFLRESTFKPTLGEWLIASAIFLVSSFFIYLLIIQTYQFLLFSYTRYLSAHYRHISDKTEMYSWFIASFSTVSGLNWAMSFLLRNRLNVRSFKTRFALRIAYHYLNLNTWGNMAWITRFLYHLAILQIMLFVDNVFDPAIDYKWFLVLLTINMFLNTWLMAHRFLKKNYFKYLSLSSICLLFAFGLMALKSIDFAHYNRLVKKRSVFSQGEFYLPKVNTLVFEPGTYNSIPLFVYGDKEARLPLLRSKKWGRYRFVEADYITDKIQRSEKNVVLLHVNQEVTLRQLWLLEDELRMDKQSVILHYRAEAPFEPWSKDLFSYRWNSESRFLGPCELNDPVRPEGAACRGLILGDSPNVLYIEYEQGQAYIDQRAMTIEQILYSLNNHFEIYQDKSIILIDPALDITFEAYTLFKDQIKSHIVEMRKRYLYDQYQMTYDYHSTYQSKSAQLTEVEKKIPMNIVNLNRENGKMFSDTYY